MKRLPVCFPVTFLQDSHYSKDKQLKLSSRISVIYRYHFRQANEINTNNYLEGNTHF